MLFLLVLKLKVSAMFVILTTSLSSTEPQKKTVLDRFNQISSGYFKIFLLSVTFFTHNIILQNLLTLSNSLWESSQ